MSSEKITIVHWNVMGQNFDIMEPKMKKISLVWLWGYDWLGKEAIWTIPT